MRGAGRLGNAIQRGRVLKYRALSTCEHVRGEAATLQPVLFVGDGSITLGSGVVFGWRTSALFYAGYCHVEATMPGSTVEIGDDVWINNNAFIKSEGPGITIRRGALLGSGVTIYDSDFHDLRPGKRHGGQARTGAVLLCEDVFVGDGVKILKGVRVGAHSVIGAGSVVTRSIPAGVVAAGNPARVLRALSEQDAAREAGPPAHDELGSRQPGPGGLVLARDHLVARR
jgi:maltose O-acetyltransferase